MTTTLQITQPDDWHLHLRDGDALATTVPASARIFGRAIIMPNLTPPVTTVAQAQAYRKRILAARPRGSTFEPLMTLYLTDATTPNDIKAAKESNVVHAVKWYPAGATTNSQAGVTATDKLQHTFAALEKYQLPLLIHGEVTTASVDIFDREKVFIDTVLYPLCQTFSELRVVLEHITTQDAVQFVEQANDNIAATLTAHHLLANRNHLLAGGIKPHYYCLPVLKRAEHQKALIAAAISGNKKFFLGTDSAPHTRSHKESACGCAGIYTAFAALEFYAEVFEQHHALDKLEAFCSFHGADFYGLPRNNTLITLKKHSWDIPKSLAYGTGSGDTETLVPFRAGTACGWMAERSS